MSPKIACRTPTRRKISDSVRCFFGTLYRHASESDSRSPIFSSCRLEVGANSEFMFLTVSDRTPPVG